MQHKKNRVMNNARLGTFLENAWLMLLTVLTFFQLHFCLFNGVDEQLPIIRFICYWHWCQQCNWCDQPSSREPFLWQLLLCSFCLWSCHLQQVGSSKLPVAQGLRRPSNMTLSPWCLIWQQGGDVAKAFKLSLMSTFTHFFSFHFNVVPATTSRKID